MAQKNEQNQRDYTQDAFPTTARPIVNRLFGLVAFIIALCIGLYLMPEDQDDANPTAPKSDSSEKLIHSSGHIPAGMENLPSGAKSE